MSHRHADIRIGQASKARSRSLPATSHLAPYPPQFQRPYRASHGIAHLGSSHPGRHLVAHARGPRCIRHLAREASDKQVMLGHLLLRDLGYISCWSLTKIRF
eukprot:4347347-Pleurochrysis_carterae.AAC.2